VFSNNFFEKIKPIVKSLKDSAKVKKKEYKDQATSMEKSPKGSELFRRNEGKKID
jgi:hypothetical protein